LAGGLAGWGLLAVLTATLARFAGGLAGAEYFALILAALMLLARLGPAPLVKGLAAVFLAAAAAMAGADSAGADLAGGNGRLDFGLQELATGFGLLPVVLGILVLGPLIGGQRGVEKTGGASGSHNLGAAAQSAAGPAALATLLGIGLPAGAGGVLLLGTLSFHNLTPGPLLFRDAPGAAGVLVAAALIAGLAAPAIRMIWLPLAARITPQLHGYLVAPIVVFCLLGAFAEDNRLFDVWVMLGFGLAGLVMQSAKVPAGLFLIAYILAPLAEARLRAAWAPGDGGALALVTDPLSLVFLGIALAALAWPSRRRRRPSM
jgi:putative tricarboxylic transport membrane protein